MDKVKAQQWVDELRSGKYAQGKCKLKWGGRYCCLGVADEAVMDRMTLSGDFKAGALITEEMELLGIDQRITKEVQEKYNLPGAFYNLHNTLQYVNDDLGWDFNQIADFLEDVLELQEETPQQKMDKWLDALESGEYNQTQQMLGNPDVGMCCMGVANHVVFNDRDFYGEAYLSPELGEQLGLEEALTSDEVGFFNFLAKLQDHGYRMIDTDSPRKYLLGNLNDTLGYDFKQIATVIRHLGWDKV